MDSVCKNNIVDKYFNDINKKYDSDDIRLLIKSIDPKYGIVASNENIDLLSTSLYKLNKLLSKIIQAYELNDKTILNNNGLVDIDDNMWYKIKNQLDENNEFLTTFSNISKQVCTSGCKKYTLVKCTNNEYESVQVGGFIGSDPDASTFTKVLDLVQFILDIAGFIPGAGIVIDIVGTVLSLSRGDFTGAMFSAINIIPLVGSFIGTPMKYIKKYRKYHKYAKKAQKYSGHAQDAMDYMPSGEDEYDEEYE